MKENNVIERDILLNSYYVIDYFEEHGIRVSHLKLQKLMYFLEAIYMTITDSTELYDTEFYAWPYGPVSKELYKKYKVFGSLPVEISEQEKQEGRIRCKNINKYVKILFNMFGKMTPADLVTLTHVPGSPWYKKNEEYIIGDTDMNIIIPKEETKEWFKKLVKIDEQ